MKHVYTQLTTSNNEVKEKLLPLQWTALWHKWAMHDKEKYGQVNRKDTAVTQYNSQRNEGKQKFETLK